MSVASWGVKLEPQRTGISAAISSKRKVWNTFQITRIPARNRTSPTRVTRNAFFAALAASGLWYQNPMRRYEHSPMISQKIRSWRKLSALTVPSIPATKRAISA